MNILSGTIFITDDINIIFNSKLNDNNKVISLDEDGTLDKLNNSHIIGGTCLLPPIEAKIAEADGNEQMYDSLYDDHLLQPYQQQFIGALISFLYKNGNLILYLPEIGYTGITIKKLIEHLYRLYGIHIGLIGSQNPVEANCYYDATCIPIWLNLIFSSRVISAREYLIQYPEDAIINNESVMYLLLKELQPYGETLNDKINYINSYRKKLKKNNNLIPAIHSVWED